MCVFMSFNTCVFSHHISTPSSALQLQALLRKVLAQKLERFLRPMMALALLFCCSVHAKAYSSVTKCFMPSNKCGVTCEFRYCRAGAPWSMACTGTCAGPLGCGEFRAEVEAGTGEGADRGAETICAGCCCCWTGWTGVSDTGATGVED